MTQVDLGLTGLTRLIRSLALITVIKNLGRHNASRAIYIPLTESHASINSSSTAEEQRSLRDTISEMRVVLVV
jgi:hypothetical protein